MPFLWGMSLVKDLFVLLLLITAIAPAKAQMPIAAARDLALGSVVTIRGVVTNGSELGSIRYMQDATGGIAIFPGTGSVGGFAPTRGSEISVTGPLKLFNGLLEIDPVQSFTLHGTNVPLPTPQPITPNGMGETNESELVRIPGCTITGGGGNFASGTVNFSSGGQSGRIFLRSGHPLVGTPIPSGIVDLVGIVSQFSSANPPVGGYQLLLRTSADLASSNTITVMGEVAQQDISANGFALRWSTNLPGTARVRYGLTPAMTSLATALQSTTLHTVVLNGLLPARAYYAQAYTVAGTDTAWAPVGIYSTASPDPGQVRVYFNKPVDTSVALGPPAIDLGNALDDTIKAYMDRALFSLEVAVFNTTSSLLVNAANDAHDRGVAVRWIAESSNSNSALSNLRPGIGLLYRTNSGGSGMHNKFVVVDADGGPAAHVLTGSANFTTAGLVQDANNLVVVRDMALARTYRTEFEEMWGGTGTQPNAAQSRFGPDKTNNTPHLFNVNGTMVQCWFSPTDGTTARISDALHTANASVEFALFAFTSSTLAEALVDVRAAGATVRGMMEEEDLNLNTFNTLLAGGVDVRPDGAPTSLHHKYAIVDRGLTASDPLVITGSHNWSFNAENINDENTLIIHSAELADQFHQEWNARWTTAVNVPEREGPGALRVWPNPTEGMLWLDAGSYTNVALGLFDLSGKLVHLTHWQGNGRPLDLSDLSPGVYLLRMEAGEHAHAVTLVKLP